ncbi:MAG: hypothetical protein GY832_42975 [Chloroflexi bacterium]|nr:hypothetical protein [Chloroflexota bacterium]
MPSRYRPPNIAQTLDVSAVSGIGRLSVPTMCAPERTHLGLPTETLRSTGVDPGSCNATAAINATAVND